MKFYILTVLIGTLSLLSLPGCNGQGDDRLIEKTQIEGREQVRTQNQNLENKAREMEADLASRQLFYQSVSGTYEGKFALSDGTERMIRITLVPSLPPYTSGRTRQLEEITSDLNNLSFRAQVTEWDPKSELSGMGCNVENIRAVVAKGEITIASSDCPILYALKVSDPQILQEETGSSTQASQARVAERVAQLIINGQIRALPQLVGQAYRSTSASIQKWTATRVAEE